MLDTLLDPFSAARNFLPATSLLILIIEVLIAWRIIRVARALRGEEGAEIAHLVSVMAFAAAVAEAFAFFNATLLWWDPVGTVDIRSVTFLVRELIILAGVIWIYRRFIAMAKPDPEPEPDPFDEPFGDL